MALIPMQVAVEFQDCVEGSRKTRGQLCLWGSKMSLVSPQQNLKTRGPLCLWGSKLSPVSLKQFSWSTNIPNRFLKRTYYLPCQCSQNICPSSDTTFVTNGALNFAWFSTACKKMQGSPVIVKVAFAVGVVIFTIWGLGRVVHPSRSICQNKGNSGWEKGGRYHVITSYILPLFLCAGVMFKCRTFDPVVPPTEGQIVKQLLNFVGSISAGLAVNYIISCVELLAEKFRDPNDANRSKNPVIQFMDRGWYCVFRISATLIFIEALGFPVMNWNLDKVIVSVFSTLVLLEIWKRTRAVESTLTLKGGAADIRNPSTAAEDASLDSLDGVSTQVKILPQMQSWKKMLS